MGNFAVVSSGMSELPVHVDLDGDVLVIRLDDGKANALSHQSIDLTNAALDRAESEAKAVAIFGRPGKFCAGFDLAVMKSGQQASSALVKEGARLSMRLFGLPLPTVAGCTGHALAAGAILLNACDVRIGATGDFKIGMNEVSIGMPLPIFAVELARERLTKQAFPAATGLAQVYNPTNAAVAGYLDRVVSPEALESEVLSTAHTYAASLSRSGFARTRTNVRQATIDHVHATLDADLGDFDVAS